MSENNKAILEAANAVIAQGNYEGFLSFCADDTECNTSRISLEEIKLGVDSYK